MLLIVDVIDDDGKLIVDNNEIAEMLNEVQLCLIFDKEALGSQPEFKKRNRSSKSSFLWSEKILEKFHKNSLIVNECLKR